MLELIREGWRDLGEYGPVYSFAVFEMLAQLLRLLAGGKHAHALRLWLAESARFVLKVSLGLGMAPC
ncbi:hypothetical protein [Magnetospirillum sp. 15-1]|uniref:hypothetical protein n=1 Tax=Magnetospirillum sp. 15-1 TaxID=1979370 RepID=UPI0011421304|nr:hypothetical protein [Magnetospirillum sp. 15-1]